MLRVASGARTVGLTTPTPKLFEERETPRQDAVMASAERRTREQTVCSTHTHHNTPKQKQKTKLDNHSHKNHNHEELIATRCIRGPPWDIRNEPRRWLHAHSKTRAAARS